MMLVLYVWVQKPVHDWENPSMFNQYKEEPHATLMPFRSVNEALNQKRQQSVFYQRLSGKWKFKWVRKPADRPIDFYLPDYTPHPAMWEVKYVYQCIHFDQTTEGYRVTNFQDFIDLGDNEINGIELLQKGPQGNGYKTEIRWFELRNENGFGLRVTGDSPLGLSALHNPTDDFDMNDPEDYRHTNDIVKKDGVFITTDLKQMGVAGDNSWGARPYPQYSLPAKTYAFSFTIEPVFN